MAVSPEHIARLLTSRMQGTINAEELAELELWLAEPERNRHFLNELENDAQFAEWLLQYRRETANRDTIYSRVMSEINSTPVAPATIVHRVHFLHTAWFRVAVAVIILFGIGTYIFSHISKPDKEVAIEQPSPKSSDIAPGFNRATLTLSDGKTIVLDSAASESITDGNLFINNDNGHLIYQSHNSSKRNPQSSESGNPGLNTMTTPRGGQYQLTLSDGTKVWLNAASSITYPTAFTGSTREVSVIGEAYFEVKADKSRPFIVKAIQEEITVLGTSFNVNCYTDEPEGKITLINGSVRIADKILQPGQALINGRVVQTNIDQDIAWKNGKISFEDKTGEQVLREIGRWYDLTIVNKEKIADVKFFGSVKRSVSLSTVVKVLEKSGITVKIEGKKLIVQ